MINFAPTSAGQTSAQLNAQGPRGLAPLVEISPERRERIDQICEMVRIRLERDEFDGAIAAIERDRAEQCGRAKGLKGSRDETLADLGVSIRLLHMFESQGIFTIGELADRFDDLVKLVAARSLPNVGEKTLQEIQGILTNWARVERRDSLYGQICGGVK